MANEVVAGMLAGREEELPCAFRVHEQPSQDPLMATVPVLRELELLRAGEAEKLVSGDPFVIQALIDRAEGTPAEAPANALLRRSVPSTFLEMMATTRWGLRRTATSPLLLGAILT